MFKEIPLSDNVVVLSIGSNLGNKLENIEKVYLKLKEKLKIAELFCSPLIITESWGYDSENSFLNCAAAFETNIKNPEELLGITQNIEHEIGRTAKTSNRVYCDRLIDIDIVFFGSRKYQSSNLEIPHIKMKERSFVLVPISLLKAPFFSIDFKKYIHELITNCPDDSSFEMFTPI